MRLPLTKAELRKTQKFFDHLAFRYGLPQEAEDAAQTYHLKRLEGSALHQRPGFAFIDYIRSVRGDDREGRKPPQFLSERTLNRQAYGANEDLRLIWVDFQRLAEALQPMDRALVTLHVFFGLEFRELGLAFGFTESQACRRFGQAVEAMVGPGVHQKRRSRRKNEA